MAGKRIVLSFDGTWNAPGDDGDIGAKGVTNVWKLHAAVAPKDAQGVEQLAWYQKGVGTRWYDRLRGGAFGVGLSRNVREGYGFLVDRYEPGDQLFVLGFSRGAYTARSLVGMIRNAGLLHRKERRRIAEAEALYRSRDEGASSANAMTFRERYAREIDIHFLGVWDTVGALGVPLDSFDWFNRPYYEFHDTELSGIVANAFHAIAVDEHRESYAATLWQAKPKRGQHVEQVWFAGAHCNVGGGYGGNRLSDVPLLWMAEKAQGCGLALDPSKLPAADPAAAEDPVVDSYRRFLRGAYRRLRPRHWRHIGHVEHGREDVHGSVLTRCGKDGRYRPQNAVWPSLHDFRRFPNGRLW